MIRCPRCNGQVMTSTEGDPVIGYERVAKCLQCGRVLNAPPPLPVVKGTEPGHYGRASRAAAAW